MPSFSRLFLEVTDKGDIQGKILKNNKIPLFNVKFLKNDLGMLFF